MNERENIRWESEENIPDPFKTEGVDLTDMLVSAEALIERLEALDELTYPDKEEALVMIGELEKKENIFQQKGLPVPVTIDFAINKLKVFSEGKTRTIREVYAEKEALPDSPARILAEAAKLELRLVEQEAAGTLASQMPELRDQINEMLNKLTLVSQTGDADMRSIAESQRIALEKFV